MAGPSAGGDRRLPGPGGAGEQGHCPPTAAYVGGDDRTAYSWQWSISPSWPTSGSPTSADRRTPRHDGIGPRRSDSADGLGLGASASQVRVCRSYTEASVAEAAEQLLGSTHDITAIVCGNDLIALGALSVLAEAGVRCPDDVSVIGFNHMAMVDRLTPPLRTVRLPLQQIGEPSARMLRAEIEGGPQSAGAVQTLLGVQLEVRGTTAGPPPG